MDSSRGDGQWSDWPEAEEKFRQTLLRLKRENASSQMIADEVARSPYILGLVWWVTKKDYLATRRNTVGASGQKTAESPSEAGGKPRWTPHLPSGWEDRLANDWDGRDDWRSETVCELIKSCRRGGMFRCDPERPKVGPYWRRIVEFKAIRAADRLRRQEQKWRQPRKDVKVLSDAEAIAEKPVDEEKLMDARLDIAMLVDGLEDKRQRAVMRLSAVEGYNYPEIAARLRISFEQVRYAVEQARIVLEAKLKKRTRR
jgi:RNA polymerase sigma factor (sigma-70 family)